MRYSGVLLNRIRKRTKNTDYTTASDGEATAGITDDLILEYLNDAQDYLQGRILSVFPDEFVASEDISITSATSYTVSDRIFMDNRIISVKYSPNGQNRYYKPLRPVSIAEQNHDTNSHPLNYVRKNGGIDPSPVATNSSGKLRVFYYRSLGDVDIRRGTISSGGEATSTSIVLADDSYLDNNALGDAEFFCINNVNGTVSDYNVTITSYDSGTRTITIPSTVIVGADGAYITLGKYTTTHSKLPDEAERFIKLYAQKRVLLTDENSNSVAEDSEVQEAMNDIIQTFADVSQDIEQIPIYDWEVMS